MESSLNVFRLGAGLPERVAARIQMLLAAAPNPQAAARLLARLRQDSPSAFDRIASSPAALRCEVNLFSYSQFLSQTVLRNPERILRVANSGSFYRVLSAEEYAQRLTEFLGKDTAGAPAAVDLARFRRQQLLRIVLRDVMGVAALSEVTADLSNPADPLLRVT